MADERLCSIPGCGKRHLAKGWCLTHYTRWHRRGDPLSLAPAKPERLCSIEGCGRKHEANGFCNGHYKSFKKHGDPLKSGQWGKQKVCTIPNCTKPYYAHGLCAMHNYRRRERGSPTGGRAFNGDAWRFFEEIVLNWTSDECLPWPYTKSHGYGVIARHGQNRTMLVHRLACEARHGAPPNKDMQAAHRCGNPWCCNPNHSEWDTALGNANDKIRHGTCRRKLSEHDVRHIRRIATTTSPRKIANGYGVSQETIRALLSGRTYRWVRD